MSLRRTPDRTVRDEMAILERLGFRYLGMNAGGHHLFQHPEHGALRPMSSTPRNPRTWRVRHRSEVAGLLGLSLWQFERLIAGQTLRKPPSRKRAHRARSRSSRSVVSLVTSQPSRPRATRVRLDKPACVDCGKPWLSDLDYENRPCSACGGAISIIREEAA